MTKSVPWWLLTGLVLALVAVNHRRAPEAPLDPATMTELSRRLDLVVSGVSSALPSPSRDPDLSASKGSGVPDHH